MTSRGANVSLILKRVWLAIVFVCLCFFGIFLVGCESDAMPVALVYDGGLPIAVYTGQECDLSSAKFTVIYDDNTLKTISADECTYSNLDTNTAGVFDVVFSYVENGYAPVKAEPIQMQVTDPFLYSVEYVSGLSGTYKTNVDIAYEAARMVAKYTYYFPFQSEDGSIFDIYAKEENVTIDPRDYDITIYREVEGYEDQFVQRVADDGTLYLVEWPSGEYSIRLEYKKDIIYGNKYIERKINVQAVDKVRKKVEFMTMKTTTYSIYDKIDFENIVVRFRFDCFEDGALLPGGDAKSSRYCGENPNSYTFTLRKDGQTYAIPEDGSLQGLQLEAGTYELVITPKDDLQVVSDLEEDKYCTTEIFITVPNEEV